MFGTMTKDEIRELTNMALIHEHRSSEFVRRKELQIKFMNLNRVEQQKLINIYEEFIKLEYTYEIEKFINTVNTELLREILEILEYRGLTLDKNNILVIEVATKIIQKHFRYMDDIRANEVAKSLINDNEICLGVYGDLKAINIYANRICDGEIIDYNTEKSNNIFNIAPTTTIEINADTLKNKKSINPFEIKL